MTYGNSDKSSNSRGYAEEIKKMEYEPLDSVEKKLIWYTFFTGIIC